MNHLQYELINEFYVNIWTELQIYLNTDAKTSAFQIAWQKGFAVSGK